MSSRLSTSQSVTEKHPDKTADQIGDTILDALPRLDPAARVAVETLVTTGQARIAGEATTARVDIPALVTDKTLDIGYDSGAKGFDGASCGISVFLGAHHPNRTPGGPR